MEHDIISGIFRTMYLLTLASETREAMSHRDLERLTVRYSFRGPPVVTPQRFSIGTIGWETREPACALRQSSLNQAPGIGSSVEAPMYPFNRLT